MFAAAPATHHCVETSPAWRAIEEIFRGSASFSKVSGERRNIHGDKETAKQYISFGTAGVSEARLLRAFVTVSYFR